MNRRSFFASLVVLPAALVPVVKVWLKQQPPFAYKKRIAYSFKVTDDLARELRTKFHSSRRFNDRLERFR